MAFFRHTVSLVLALCFYTAAQSQCPADSVLLTLNINADQYYYECSWTITDASGAVLFEGAPTSENPETYTYCLPANDCLKFNIIDDYGDGINPGSYSLSLGNAAPFYTNPDGGYGNGETIPVNCPPGASCIDPIIMDLGDYYAPLTESWYAFYPSDTGLYTISTCFPENTCRTKVWVYDVCNPNFAQYQNVIGTIFYEEDGCPTTNLAEAKLFLAGNQLYYVRIGMYDPMGCSLDSIRYTVTYDGEVQGCMDPNACNYEPLATLPDTCYQYGDPECTDGPDLAIDEARLKQFFNLYAENNTDACAVYEGCINGYGTRHKIRFSTLFHNIGSQDYFIGETPATPNTIDPTGQFVYDRCHNHWHYRGYADYLLADMDGNLLPLGSKNGFCVLDYGCTSGDFKYTCGNMGISAGCYDEYDHTLDCQWIDITGLEAGQYTMICRVNWRQWPDKAGRRELTYDNNWAQVCFDLSYDNGQPQMTKLNDCPVFVDCEGTVRGDARRDCKGDCNGSALMGDLNSDTLRNDMDLQQYMLHALEKDGIATACYDLYEDGQLSLYDAALLNECAVHGNDDTYWASSFGCVFPTGQTNPIDRHIFQIQDLNTTDQTFVIALTNQSRALLGVDLTISGAVIESVEEVHPTYDSVTIMTKPNEGRIMAFSAVEKGATRFSTYRPLFKVKYSALTNDTICIQKVDEVVNDLYELATPVLSNFKCLPVTSSNREPLLNASILTFPNPAQEETTIVFPDLQGEWVQFTLTNATGQVVRSWRAYNNQRELMYRNGLPSGIYQLSVRTEDGLGAVRLVFE